jgi:hypothetical protein
MTKALNYVFDFITTVPVLTIRIPISALTIRRNLDSTDFGSVTIPDPEQEVETSPGVFQPLFQVIAVNQDGIIKLSKVELGVETEVASFTLNQVLTNESPSAFTIVMNGTTPAAPVVVPGTTYTIAGPITTSNDSTGSERFSAAENALILINDTIILRGVSKTVTGLTLFVNTANSRMDLVIVDLVV